MGESLFFTASRGDVTGFCVVGISLVHYAF
jgi:hypothetical protein